MGKRCRDAGISSLTDEIQARGGEGDGLVADVAEFGQVEAVAESAVERYGRLDTWVHRRAPGDRFRARGYVDQGPGDPAKHKRTPGVHTHFGGLRFAPAL